ncbi:hypothetical protein JIP62_06270 [Brevundimonas vitis]|uniref:Uncharacterized protein n=1 Tax=Brevundimonas vitisensis TaxID=2800818 RepID=A0ABX7BQ09_9CAUL|nr:hypothetical protein [Brevundimonas vitisensis]QQQ19689.1 hypothetical protein JIP62_06270 [Brevundimonas vitisensis]
MLTACHGSAATEAGPIVEVRSETIVTCPAELLIPVQPRPAVPAGAVVEFNAEGATWLASEMAWGEGGWARLIDAQGQCPRPAAEAAD